MSEAVISAVADAEGISLLDVHPPLATVLDPDALDALFQTEKYDGQVMFTYRGYEILVRADGTVILDAADE